MTDENLEITQNIKDGVCKISVKGRIDSNSADLFLEKLETAIEEGQKNIILSMFHVQYLSSIGIRIILKIYKKLSEEGGSFKIEHPSEIVKNVLGMVALQEMLITN
ncbi:STAS domain-containing protein [Treponema sp. R6D11]